MLENLLAHPEVTDSLPIRSLEIKSTTSDTSAAPPTSEADRNEICLYFLRRQCRFKGEIANYILLVPFGFLMDIYLINEKKKWLLDL